jgi:hypothetical protein
MLKDMFLSGAVIRVSRLLRCKIILGIGNVELVNERETHPNDSEGCICVLSE